MEMPQTDRQPTADGPPTPPLSLKERQRQEREQLILTAAMELLIEKGYHETSMEEIAARVGISKGAVYLHFDSKEELVSALFVWGARAFVGTLSETLAGEGSPREKLGAIVQQFFGTMSKRFQLMSALVQSPELHRSLAARREAMDAIWEEPSRRMAAVIDEGKRRGEFDTVIPTPLITYLLWSLLSPHGYQRLVEREGMAVEELAACVRRYFLKGIAADEALALGGEDE